MRAFLFWLITHKKRMLPFKFKGSIQLINLFQKDYFFALFSLIAA